MNTVPVPTTIFTIANGSRLGGHVTTVHVSVKELVEEINSTLHDDEDLISHIIEEYNETAKTLGRPLYEGTVDDFDFQFIVDNDNQLESCGWGWSFDYINAMGKEDHQYLNISVHQWNKTYFESQG